MQIRYLHVRFSKQTKCQKGNITYFLGIQFFMAEDIYLFGVGWSINILILFSNIE